MNHEAQNINAPDYILTLMADLLEHSDGLEVLNDENETKDLLNIGWTLILTKGDFNLSGSRKKGNYILLIPPKGSFELTLIDGAFIKFKFNFDMLSLMINENGRKKSFARDCHQKLPESEQLRSFFTLLMEYSLKPQKHHQLKAEGMAKVIAATIYDLIFDAPHLDKYLKQTRRQISIEINNFIENNMAYSYNAADLAKKLSYSFQYLNNVNKDFRGMTLNSYIIFRRLEAFRNFFQQYDGKILSISPKFGFPNTNYLIHQFKKYYGITPHQLRKKINESTGQNLVELNKVKDFQVLEPIKKPAVIAPLKEKVKRCTLIIANASDSVIEVLWASPNNEEVLMAALEPNERKNLGSPCGFTWSIKSDLDKLYYKTAQTNCIIIFT